MKINVFDPVEFEPRSTCYVASAVIGGVAALGGAGIAAYGANQASKRQAGAQMAGIDAVREMFDTARGEMRPFIDAGSSMIPSLQGWIDPTQSSSPLASLLRLTTPGSDMTAALEQTPGFQFTKEYGLKGVSNALAARGLAGPGGALARGGADYAGGLAANTWEKVVNALLGTFQAGATPMQNLVDTGARTASSVGTMAGQAGANIQQGFVGLGNAQGAGIQGMTTPFANMTQQALPLSLLSKMGGGGGSVYPWQSAGGWAPSTAWYNN